MVSRVYESLRALELERKASSESEASNVIRPVSLSPTVVPRKTSSRMRLPLVLFVLMFGAFAFVRKPLQKGAVQVRQSEENPTAKRQELPETRGPVVRLPKTEAAGNPGGFILQVGAMRREENARALAASLAQKDLPAFVIKPDTDEFYRVAVGPYDSADAAQKVRSQLTGQGIEVIVRRRNIQTR